MTRGGGDVSFHENLAPQPSSRTGSERHCVTEKERFDVSPAVYITLGPPSDPDTAIAIAINGAMPWLTIAGSAKRGSSDACLTIRPGCLIAEVH